MPRGAGRLRDDEAVGHVPHGSGRRGAERAHSRRGSGHAGRRAERRRPLLDLLEVAREVAREVVERPARGRHVHEPEERRAQVGVLGRALERPGVERAQRMPRPGGKGGSERGPDLAQLGLDRRLVRKLGGGHLGHGTKATPAAPGSG